MKTHTFSIVVGTAACNANCPYCVSKMTQTKACKASDIRWGLAFVPALAPYPLVIADASQNKLLKTDGTTFSTLRDCGGDPKKLAVDNQSTAAASKIIYGYNADTVRKVDCDGTDDIQLCDINRMPTMLTYNPDDQYVYMLKTSSALAKVKIDGTNHNSALYTWVSHDIRGIAYNPQ